MRFNSLILMLPKGALSPYKISVIKSNSNPAQNLNIRSRPNLLWKNVICRISVGHSMSSTCHVHVLYSSSGLSALFGVISEQVKHDMVEPVQKFPDYFSVP